MEIEVNEKSSLPEIDMFVKKFPQKQIYDNNDVDCLLSNLVSLKIDTYSFTFGANSASRTINKSIIPKLKEYLSCYKNKQEGFLFEKAFAAYYLLSYYFREYEKLEQLEKLIAEYEDLFTSFALTHQIKGRLLRRNGNGKKALDCDLYAMSMLKQKGIDNLGVNITYASTVSIALENKELYITRNDVNKAFKNIEEAIHINQKYAKYPYLKAKLIMFSLNFDGENKKYELCKLKISEAKECLLKAIELEDEKSDAYMAHIIEYKSYMRQADLILSEIRMSIKIKEQADKANISIEDSFKKNQEIIDDKLQQTQNRFLELLALFVSVISVVITVISMFSNAFTITQTLIAIIVMNASVLAVYSAFLILMRQKVQVKYIIILLLSMLIILICIGVTQYRLLLDILSKHLNYSL